MALVSSLKLKIAEKLEGDKGFRKRFFRGQVQDQIAMCIKALREERHLRQIDLANESKMKQSAISRIEQADYSAWSFNTLFRIADALDARLRVTLEPIEDVIEQYRMKEAANETMHFMQTSVSGSTVAEMEGLPETVASISTWENVRREIMSDSDSHSLQMCVNS